jgi:putative membrane protein
MRRAILAGAVLLTAPLLPALTGVSTAALAAVSDKEFVKTVAMSDMFEVESGKLAADQAGSAKVKSFGDKMVDDHSKTTDAIEEIIDDEDIDVTLPDDLDQQHQAKIDQLKDLSGPAFDRAYIPMQVSAHEKAVDLFQDYADGGENAALKKWAAATLPALKGHLDEAKQLSSEIKMAADDAEKSAKSEEKRAETDKSADKSQRKNRAAAFEYVARQEPTDWTAQALIGRTVENERGENLGDINNVILNEKGDVKAVTIGVGGFLGIGEKNVGVPFEALQFETAASDNVDSSNKKQPADERDARENREARFDSEHSDIKVVLNATKEQLESAPAFVWLDDQRSSERAVQ